MYVKIVNQTVEAYPYSFDDLKKEHSEISFPAELTNEGLAEWGIFPVRPQNPPVFNPSTQRCERVLPTLRGGGWVETWKIIELSSEEAEAKTKEREEEVRAQRNSYLYSYVDSINVIRWSAMSEEQKVAWINYRQTLLDITKQPEFPWDVIWPEVPEA
jgi:hypothetical protein